MKKSNIEPNLNYVLEQFKENILNNLNCIKIGKIETFYSNDKTADISICFKKKENEEIKDYPLLLKCPVICNHITYPIKSGEFCIVLFNDVNLDSWFENTNNQIPYTLEKHCISDGIAIVGLNNLIDKITDYETDRIDLRENTVISGELEVEKKVILDKTLLVKEETTIEKTTEIKDLLKAKTIISGGMSTDELGNITAPSIQLNNGWSGTFLTGDSRTVTVVKGIIINVG